MKKFFFILLSISMFSCEGQKKGEATATPEVEEVALNAEPAQEQMLLGTQERAALEEAPYKGWYQANYKEYTPDAEFVEKLKPLVEGVKITVFMGTWCEDSQREVPAFFKLLDELQVSEEAVTLITMNREKTTPENLEKGLEITNVPTLIFTKNGKELNRIVEFPIDTLEEDMYKILSGQEYKHAYAW
ncbi:thioredoxin family protein [Robertkochia flava]|uniref:thioredoxin family protein n=1 Tax=Robertkochia flava TaxID=3447986 RepID=UPI001CC9B94E|nr:thioredoxin family protein [Robertkochia marina]